MKRVLVVLSGGGTKGLAHIGALRVLRRLDLPIVAFAGTSVGALVAAFAASGMTVAEMETTGLSVTRRDFVDFDWFGMMRKGMRVPAANRGVRLFDFISRSVPAHTFDELQTPLFVNAADLASGANIVFGLPGLRDVPLHRVIAASCSIPGVYPPVRIRDRYFIDGAAVDNLQLRLAKVLDVDFVVAVNLRSYVPINNRDVSRFGFLDNINRGNDLTGQTITEINLATPIDVPGIIVHPEVVEQHYFGFENISRLIEEGERATETAFARFNRSRHDGLLSRLFTLGSRRVGNPFVIDRKRCVQCGLCVINNMDGLFQQATPGGPVTVDRRKPSTHDVAPLKECPFGAIRVDQELLREMYGDEPPTYLSDLARDQHEILGHPAFSPGPEDAVAADTEEPPEEPEENAAGLSSLLRRFSSRRRAAAAAGKNGTEDHGPAANGQNGAAAKSDADADAVDDDGVPAHTGSIGGVTPEAPAQEEQGEQGA